MIKTHETEGTQRDEAFWIAERIRFGLTLLQESTAIDPAVRGGVPVLKNTRFPVSRILAELAAGATISQLAVDYEIDENLIRSFLDGLAIHLDQPFVK